MRLAYILRSTLAPWCKSCKSCSFILLCCSSCEIEGVYILNSSLILAGFFILTKDQWAQRSLQNSEQVPYHVQYKLGEKIAFFSWLHITHITFASWTPGILGFIPSHHSIPSPCSHELETGSFGRDSSSVKAWNLERSSSNVNMCQWSQAFSGYDLWIFMGRILRGGLMALEFMREKFSSNVTLLHSWRIGWKLKSPLFKRKINSLSSFWIEVPCQFSGVYIIWIYVLLIEETL